MPKREGLNNPCCGQAIKFQGIYFSWWECPVCHSKQCDGGDVDKFNEWFDTRPSADQHFAAPRALSVEDIKKIIDKKGKVKVLGELFILNSTELATAIHQAMPGVATKHICEHMYFENMGKPNQKLRCDLQSEPTNPCEGEASRLHGADGTITIQMEEYEILKDKAWKYDELCK